ncbi:MAG: GNAT family N-acetyltransferase [Ancrocorticia sp.]
MSSPHVFVRPATALDAAAIGDIQVRTMRAALVAALGKRLPERVETELNSENFARSWGQAITSPPSPAHLVFSAVAEGSVVGFAALAPTAPQPLDEEDSAGPWDDDEAEDSEAESDDAEGGGELEGRGAGHSVVEVTALEVPPAYQRAGHGSRLIAAAASSAIEQGAAELQIWVLAGDDAHTSFLTAAGFAPTGLRRDLQVGDDVVTQHCWHAFLNTEA